MMEMPIERFGPSMAEVEPLPYDEDTKEISNTISEMFLLLSTTSSNQLPNELELSQKTNELLILKSNQAKSTVDQVRNDIRGLLLLTLTVVSPY